MVGTGRIDDRQWVRRGDSPYWERDSLSQGSVLGGTLGSRSCLLTPVPHSHRGHLMSGTPRERNRPQSSVGDHVGPYRSHKHEPIPYSWDSQCHQVTEFSRRAPTSASVQSGASQTGRNLRSRSTRGFGGTPWRDESHGPFDDGRPLPAPIPGMKRLYL